MNKKIIFGLVAVIVILFLEMFGFLNLEGTPKSIEEYRAEREFYFEFEFIGLEDQYVVGETATFNINQKGYGILCGTWEAWIEKDGKTVKGLGTMMTQCMAEAKPIEFDTDFYFSAEKPLVFKSEEIGKYTVKAKHSEYGPTSIGEKSFIVLGS